jgi:hypothetical protein
MESLLPDSTDSIPVVNNHSHEGDCVLILLASYNGEEHIGDQISSIQEQNHGKWQLFIRDDGSSDNTVSIIRQFCRQDSRIRLIEDSQLARPGSVGNFGRLMKHALDNGADYIAFADQDDVWKKDKLCSQLETMKDTESRTGTGTPALVHSDLEVVNKHLNQVHPSFMNYQGLDPANNQSLQTLLGCPVRIGLRHYYIHAPCNRTLSPAQQERCRCRRNTASETSGEMAHDT